MGKFKKNLLVISSLGCLFGCQLKTADRAAGDNMGPKAFQRQDLVYLENKLHTQKEKDQYSRVLQWFENDDERREFLMVDGFEARQNWIQDHKMWERGQKIADQYKDIIANKDIAIGMPMELVQKSWGEPESKDSSGQPWYKNERWKYSEYKSSSSGYKQQKKMVYFERGKVIGWETE